MSVYDRRKEGWAGKGTGGTAPAAVLDPEQQRHCRSHTAADQPAGTARLQCGDQYQREWCMPPPTVHAHNCLSRHGYGATPQVVALRTHKRSARRFERSRADLHSAAAAIVTWEQLCTDRQPTDLGFANCWQVTQWLNASCLSLRTTQVLGNQCSAPKRRSM